jgi:hypothetical protein
MSTSTPTRGLVKPDPAENVDITVLNANADILDKAPLGFFGSAQIGAEQGPYQVQVDVAGLSVTKTVLANRIYKVSLSAGVRMAVANGQVQLFVFEDATQIMDLQQDIGVGGIASLSDFIVRTGVAAGAHTWKVQAFSTVGSNAYVRALATLLIEDIGGV